MPHSAVPQILSIGRFASRLLVIGLFIAVAGAIWQLSDIIVLLFGAVLLSIGLCGAARTICRHTGLGRTWAMAVVVLMLLTLFAAALWVFGATIAAQIAVLVEIVPDGFRLFMTWLDGQSYGRQLLEQIHAANVMDATSWATSMVTGAAGVVTRALGYTFLALFVAAYLAAQPERYRQLVLRLVPPLQRPAGVHLLDAIGHILQRWLVGQLLAMLTIGVLSGLGLWALGINAAFALGLMGGLLCFIPFVGPILAAVPATLVALTQGPIEAGTVILRYIGVQVLEGNFITPLVQEEVTAFPPVLAILSTAAFSLLLGPSGVLLAAPLTLALLAAVEILYVQQGLGEPPEATSP